MNAPSRRPPIRVSTGNPISAVFGAFGRDFVDLFRNPLAFVGGLGGMALTSALVFLGVNAMADAKGDDEDAEDEDAFMIDFEPGALVKLGVKIDEKELPEKIIVQETRAEEEVEEVEEAVTDDAKATPATEEKPEDPPDKPKKTDAPKPTEKKDSKLPTSKLPTTANTPYKNDLPTVTQDRGDPFGDPGGWSDLAKDGDPWATSVMKELNNLKVGAFGAKMPGGNFQFELSVCKDGKITNVNRKGGTLDAESQKQVELALEQLKVPKPPANVASKMPSNCSKIKYRFNWSSGKVK
jgi:hypothetical protein